MDKHLTLDELAAFARDEVQILKSLGFQVEPDDSFIPDLSDDVLNSVLHYSQSLSIRPSTILDRIEYVNN